MSVRRRSREFVTVLTQKLAAFALPSKHLAEMSRHFMFSHTQNENGTYNTRCLHCFMTVASSVESPEELERLETQHTCPEKVLADLLARETLSHSLVLLN